jgi:hypothetical protein
MMNAGNVANREYIYQPAIKETKVDDFITKREIEEGDKTTVIFERTANTLKNRMLSALGILKKARTVDIKAHYESLGATGKDAKTRANLSVRSENSRTISAEFFEGNISRLNQQNKT